jgi:hypothetical protein
MRQIDWSRLWLRKILLMMLKVGILPLLVMLFSRTGLNYLLVRALILLPIFFGRVWTLILEVTSLRLALGRDVSDLLSTPLACLERRTRGMTNRYVGT